MQKFLNIVILSDENDSEYIQFVNGFFIKSMLGFVIPISETDADYIQFANEFLNKLEAKYAELSGLPLFKAEGPAHESVLDLYFATTGGGEVQQHVEHGGDAAAVKGTLSSRVKF